MGRHDLTLGAVLKGYASLASGLYASTPVRTPTGWAEMGDLSPGDLIVTRDHGLTGIVTTAPDVRVALWGVLFPVGALGNAQDVILPPGQPVLVETPYALPFTGEAQALVPAVALEGWRGIAPHVRGQPEPILQMRLSRAGLVEAGPGLIVGIEGAETAEADLIRMLLTAPERAVLPLASARQLMAALVGHEAGHELRAADQAAFRSANR